MEITEVDLEIEDIEWYGIDETGRIGLFMSGGSLAVPKFICKSRENLEMVCDYFRKLDNIITDDVMINNKLSYPRKEFVFECKLMSQKGVYCFDISNDEKNDNQYIFISKPQKSLNVKDLPFEIQNIMLNYKMNLVNFERDELISV